MTTHFGRAFAATTIALTLGAAATTLMIPVNAFAAVGAPLQSNEWRLCTNNGVSPDQKLAACSTVIAQAAWYSPQQVGSAFQNRGNVFSDNKKDYNRPIADYSQAIRLDPRNSINFNNRGNSYRVKGLFDRAISELDRAVGLATNAGDRALALSNRAAAYVDKATWDFDAYVNEGRYETLAVRDANEAVQLQPNNPFIFNTRALAYVKARQYGWAAADYSRAIALNPNQAFFIPAAPTLIASWDRPFAPQRTVAPRLP
jgi:tetratricopeptide (TPR) repeat protein